MVKKRMMNDWRAEGNFFLGNYTIVPTHRGLQESNQIIDMRCFVVLTYVIS